MKKLGCLFVAIILSFSWFPALADTTKSEFVTFFQEAIVEDSFYAMDAKENDITEFVASLYMEEGIDNVYAYFIEKSGSIGYTSENVNLNTRTIEDAVTVSNSKYTIANEVNGLHFTREWRTRLTGTYYFDSRTGLITRAVQPSLYIEYHNFGTDFLPYLANVRTNAYVTNQSYATFSATYTMMIDVSNDGFYGQGIDSLNYGTHTHSFTTS